MRGTFHAPLVDWHGEFIMCRDIPMHREYAIQTIPKQTESSARNDDTSLTVHFNFRMRNHAFDRFKLYLPSWDMHINSMMLKCSIAYTWMIDIRKITGVTSWSQPIIMSFSRRLIDWVIVWLLDWLSQPSRPWKSSFTIMLWIIFSFSVVEETS